MNCFRQAENAQEHMQKEVKKRKKEAKIQEKMMKTISTKKKKHVQIIC
jgi:hypothetical protein